MNFRVGDYVKAVDVRSSRLEEGKVYRVTEVNGHYVKLNHEGYLYDSFRFEKATPNLETELRLCESRRGTLCKRIGEDQEEKKSLEKRIQELQQAIKERDKPKGRVGIKDRLYPSTVYYLVRASGNVSPHNFNAATNNHVAMGNLFYDKESAERAVHDRKQRVLRGEDV